VTEVALQHRTIATAGHVDHGKSTLLEALTGMRPERLTEERRRGMTIDLGFVWTSFADPDRPGRTHQVAFVDVPGHERFIGTMLAGTGAGPGALFVVAADGGWSSQSAEHRDLLDLLACPVIAVVITKADLVDDERIAEVLGEIEAEAEGTVLAGAPVAITDALTGRGISALADLIGRRLDVIPRPPDRGRARLWVDRSFSVSGSGTVVTGTLTGGPLRTGERGRVLPLDATVRIRSLQMLGADTESASPGSRVAVNLVGVHHQDVGRGEALVLSELWRVTSEVDVELRVLDGRELTERGTWRLHTGSAGVGCQVRTPYGPFGSDGMGLARLVLDRPLPLAHDDRVVLRDLGRRETVAGGRVLDPLPPRLPRGNVARAAHGRCLVELGAATGIEEIVHRLVVLHGGVRALADITGAVPDLDGVPTANGVRVIGDHLVEPGVLTRVRSALGEIGPGIHERVELTGPLVAAGAPLLAIDDWLDALVADGVLVRARLGFSLPEFAEAEQDASATRQAQAIAVLEAEGLEPPPFERVAEGLGLTHLERSSVLAGGDVVRAGSIVLGRRAFDDAVRRLRELEQRHGPFTASQAREELQTTRKYAIPLLEALRSRGLTAFDGTTHRFTR
jgi:selenocysteine-specific elongation factor